MKKIILLFSAIVMTVLFSCATLAEVKEFNIYIEEGSSTPYKTVYINEGKIYDTLECDGKEIECPIPTSAEMPRGKKFTGYYDIEGNICLNKDFVAGKISDAKDNKLYGHYEPSVYEIKFMYEGKVIEKAYEKYGEGFYKDEECDETLEKVKIVSIDGYKFKSYKDGDNDITDENGNIEVSKDYFYEDKEVEANLEKKILKITKKRNDGTEGDDGYLYEKYKEKFSNVEDCSVEVTKVSIPVRVGYKFLGYYKDKSFARLCVDSEGNIVCSNTEFEDDANIYAKWEEVKRKITLDKNDGSSGEIILYGIGKKYYKGIECKEEDKVTKITVPERVGYEFIGYYKDGEDTPYIDRSGKMTEKLDAYEGRLYARWKNGEYQISLMKNFEKGSMEQYGSIYEEYGVGFKDESKNDISKVDVPVEVGYNFTGYYDSEKGGTCYIDKDGMFTRILTNTKFTTNVRLYAQWSIKISKLTLVRNDDTSKIEKDIYIAGAGALRTTLSGDDKDSIDIPVREGYDFKGYVLDPSKIKEDGDIPVTKSAPGMLKAIDDDPIMIIDSTGKVTEDILKSTGTAYAYWTKTEKKEEETTAGGGTGSDDSGTGGGTGSDDSGTGGGTGSDDSGTGGSGSGTGGSGSGTGGSGSGTGGSGSGSSSKGDLDNNSNNGVGLGWRFENGKDWVYYETSSVLKKGWFFWNNKYYYLDLNDGKMAVGYRIIDKILYCFKETGEMYQNEYLNDVYIGNSGKIVEVTKYMDTAKTEYVKEKDLYKLYDINNNQLVDCFTNVNGSVYVLDKEENKDTRTILVGDVKVGDTVLHFDGSKGGVLTDVYSVKNATTFCRKAEGNDIRA